MRSSREGSCRLSATKGSLDLDTFPSEAFLSSGACSEVLLNTKAKSSFLKTNIARRIQALILNWPFLHHHPNVF